LAGFVFFVVVHSTNNMQNAFNASMDRGGKFVNEATCTTCQFADDFSNYWTAVLYFRAANGTYKRVPQRSNTGFEGMNGGMTVYYMQDPIMNFQQTSKVTAFRPVSPSNNGTAPDPSRGSA
jgi:hypothetical protein